MSSQVSLKDMLTLRRPGKTFRGGDVISSCPRQSSLNAQLSYAFRFKKEETQNMDVLSPFLSMKKKAF